MSYYADISGTIKAKTPQAADRIIEIMDAIEEWEYVKRENRIDLWTSGHNYHEDAHHELLDAIVSEDLASDYSIECIGEDSSFWGFFPSKRGGWVEKDGHIEYDDEEE